MTETKTGGCLCGEVAFAVTGDPIAMRDCRCASYRGWLAAPVHQFTMWPDDVVAVTSGAVAVKTFLLTPNTISHRQFCGKCSGAVMVRHPTLGAIDIPAVTFDALTFVPALHVNYAETVFPIRDGLPKMKGFPAEFGGTGETMPE
ncbi:MAG: GFA family protein [Sandarakinorhabdus sp.]|nr:GFA family protein [Sandarakinorhabdus sp.]